MKQLILLLDVGGYTERLRALQDVHPHVIGITPLDKPCEGFTPIEVPEEWMPDPSLPENTGLTYTQRCWHACGTLGLAAIAQLGLEADAFLFIESDCVASPQRWRAFLENNADNTDDGSFICPRTRVESLWNPRWGDPSTPAWANITHLNAIYRLSQRGVAAYLSAAVEMRECFGEMVAGSAIARAGGTIGRLNRGQTHMNNQTMKADPSRVIFNPRLINHPVKSNTYQP